MSRKQNLWPRQTATKVRQPCRPNAFRAGLLILSQSAKLFTSKQGLLQCLQWLNQFPANSRRSRQHYQFTMPSLDGCCKKDMGHPMRSAPTCWAAEWQRLSQSKAVDLDLIMQGPGPVTWLRPPGPDRKQNRAGLNNSWLVVQNSWRTVVSETLSEKCGVLRRK